MVGSTGVMVIVVCLDLPPPPLDGVVQILLVLIIPAGVVSWTPVMLVQRSIGMRVKVAMMVESPVRRTSQVLDVPVG